MDFWKIVLSKTLQEIDSETEISCRTFSGECEAVRIWQREKQHCNAGARKVPARSEAWRTLLKCPKRGKGVHSLYPYIHLSHCTQSDQREGSTTMGKAAPLGGG